MNRRHKAILFATLVATGSALLAGAAFKTAVGMMMLGTALAWVVGSDAALRGYATAKNVTSTFYVWARLPIVMAFAGGVLGIVLTFSHGNPVAAFGSMSMVGVFISPLTELPARKKWLKACLVTLCPFVFLFAVYGTLLLDPSSLNEHGGKLGSMSLAGFIALLFGVWWLSKGWRLIQKGLGVDHAEPISQEGSLARAGTTRSYISFLLGVIVLTMWIGLLTWSASSDWSLSPWQLSRPGASNTFASSWGGAGFILLLGWWPYRQWNKILRREPHSDPINLTRHKRVTASVAMLFTVVFCFAATFGVQNGTDRAFRQEIDDSNNSLRDVVTKLSALKQRDIKTTQDYIDVYSGLDSLQAEFDANIDHARVLYQKAKQMDEARGPVNIQKFYSSNNPAVWKTYIDALDMLQQVSNVTKQEIGAAKTMAALPQVEQPSFWQSEFKPLLEQEDSLRKKMISLQARTKTGPANTQH